MSAESKRTSPRLNPEPADAAAPAGDATLAQQLAKLTTAFTTQILENQRQQAARAAARETKLLEQQRAAAQAAAEAKDYTAAYEHVALKIAASNATAPKYEDKHFYDVQTLTTINCSDSRTDQSALPSMLQAARRAQRVFPTCLNSALCARQQWWRTTTRANNTSLHRAPDAVCI
jgi:hypothetical protein